MQDERIRLLLDMGMSAQEAQKVTAALDQLKTSAKNVADTYELMAVMGEGYEILERRVTQTTVATTSALKEQGAELVRIIPDLRKLGGDYSRSGGGLLGASFAAQDFVSVLSGGGGLGRALNSISNNIPQILMGLGLGGGLAGVLSVVTALVGAAIPVVESWLGTFSGPKKEAAKAAIQEIEAEIKRVEGEFKRLVEAGTDADKERAKRLKEYLEQPGRAEAVRKGIMRAGAVEAPDVGMMTEEERATFEQQQETIRAYESAPGQLSEGEREALNKAHFENTYLKQLASKRRAEQIVAGMTKTGPEGDRARAELAARAGATPRFFPTGLAADIEQPPTTAAEQARIEAEGQRNIRAFEKDRQREQDREAVKRQEAQASVQERIQRDVEAKNRGLVADAEEQQSRRRELERDKARDAAELAKEMADAAVPEETARQRRHRQAERQAGQLMAQGPEIIGQAFGPQAAQAASMATPAEVQAMRAETIKNLGEGQLPYPALLAAFEEVYRASQREAAQRRAFVGQMNGMQGRFQQMGQSAMDR